MAFLKQDRTEIAERGLDRGQGTKIATLTITCDWRGSTSTQGDVTR